MSYQTGIIAIEVVSESEIVLLHPDYDFTWEEQQREKFLKILWDFGLNIHRPYERQDGLLHRNRLGEKVLCSRWVGDSRLDDEWINSGLASKEARDKASGNKLLEDIYKMRGMTE